MPKRLRLSLLITDIGFLIYWGITALAAIKLVTIPPEWLFKDYHDPNIVAWNWSFMPLDLLASVTGLIAVRQSQWRTMAIVSATLTFCAGFLALSFWSFQGSFDPSWWAPNLFLTLWPLFMIRTLITEP
jgi:hypothetical protein